MLSTSACPTSLFIRNHLHLQGVQLQQALLDIRGGVEFTERLLSCGSDAEILSAKGVTLRRLTSLTERGYDPHPATIAPDDGSSISFMPREPAGEVEGYPVVGVINSKTVDVSRCSIEGEGKRQFQPCVQKVTQSTLSTITLLNNLRQTIFRIMCTYWGFFKCFYRR